MALVGKQGRDTMNQRNLLAAIHVMAIPIMRVASRHEGQLVLHRGNTWGAEEPCIDGGRTTLSPSRLLGTFCRKGNRFVKVGS